MKRRLFSQAMLYAIKGVDGGKEKGGIVCSGGSEEGVGGGCSHGKWYKILLQQHNNTQYCADVQFMLYTSGSRLKFLLTRELLFCNKIENNKVANSIKKVWLRSSIWMITPQDFTWRLQNNISYLIIIDIAHYLPHNPFPSMQTLDFQSQHQLPQYDKLKYVTCVLQEEMIW